MPRPYHPSAKPVSRSRDNALKRFRRAGLGMKGMMDRGSWWKLSNVYLFTPPAPISLHQRHRRPVDLPLGPPEIWRVRRRLRPASIARRLDPP